jgi:hypothetical protein
VCKKISCLLWHGKTRPGHRHGATKGYILGKSEGILWSSQRGRCLWKNRRLSSSLLANYHHRVPKVVGVSLQCGIHESKWHKWKG